MKMALPALFILLAACNSADGRNVAQMQSHDQHLKTEGDVIEALNLPTGADYAAAVSAIERSGRPPLQQQFDIGSIVLTACRDNAPYCTAPNDAAAGIARLVRVATTSGEDAVIAAGHLAVWYERGAGPTLPPDKTRADCWRKVADGSAKATTCAR